MTQNMRAVLLGGLGGSALRSDKSKASVAAANSKVSFGTTVRETDGNMIAYGPSAIGDVSHKCCIGDVP